MELFALVVVVALVFWLKRTSASNNMEKKFQKNPSPNIKPKEKPSEKITTLKKHSALGVRISISGDTVGQNKRKSPNNSTPFIAKDYERATIIEVPELKIRVVFTGGGDALIRVVDDNDNLFMFDHVNQYLGIKTLNGCKTNWTKDTAPYDNFDIFTKAASINKEVKEYLDIKLKKSREYRSIGKNIISAPYKYKIKNTSRKNNFIINVITSKSLNCKCAVTDGFSKEHYICLVDDTDGRALGCKFIRDADNKWLFEKAFDVKLKDDSFVIDGNTVHLKEFTKNKTINFDYFQVGSSRYHIDDIILT